MATLKQKNIRARSNSEAVQLPELMRALSAESEPSFTPDNRYMLPVASLRPAPDEWNFYRPLGKEKMFELTDSIRHNGLIHAVVVWQQHEGDKTYTILSGHNRVNAYKELFAQFGTPNYLLIDAYILREISEEQAREIIVDSNWVQRTLSPSERTKSICQKYALLGRKKRARSSNGEYLRNYDIIAEDYQLSGKQVQRYVKLGKLIEPLLDLIDGGELTLRAGLRLAVFGEDEQNKIYDAMFENDFETSNTRITALRRGAPVAEVLAALQEPEEHERSVKVTVEVPEALKNEFRQAVADFFKIYGVAEGRSDFALAKGQHVE